MTKARFSASTLLIVTAIAGAAAFAAGRSLRPDPAPVTAVAEPAVHPTPTSNALPPGHPPVETTGASAADPHAAGDPHGGGGEPHATVAESSLSWKAPARWEKVPNASTMRLATYRIPRASGDPQDGEIAVSQAGGSIDANVERWIGQFGPDAKKTAKRTTRKVAGMNVTIVEVEGTFAGGMGMRGAGEPEPGWALLGAIVETPGMPHFFKMTGPAKTVRAARGELDELVASLSTGK